MTANLASACLAVIVVLLVMLGTFSAHLPANIRIGCLASAFALWKVLRLSVEKSK